MISTEREIAYRFSSSPGFIYLQLSHAIGISSLLVAFDKGEENNSQRQKKDMENSF
jgi:hypothetical protein